MIFSKEKIEEIMRIIEFQHALFIGTNIGIDILTDEDRGLLRKYGIKPDEIKTDFTPYEQNFFFGRLSSILGNKNTSQLSYNDFLKYLRRGQFIPLNAREKESLKFAKQRSYSHIKHLGERIVQAATGTIVQSDQAVRDAYEKTIKNSIERAVVEKDTISSIVSEIGHKTGDWGRDLGRIAATEMQYIYEEGRAAEIEKEYGQDSLVYKEVYPQACRFCIKFYLTNGLGSKPKVFMLSELRANGTNIGRKQAEWLPTLGPVHSWCRCMLHQTNDRKVWNDDRKMFTYPKLDLNDPNRRKKGIKVTVGEKVFEL
jgi:hypothetical protein